MKIRLTEKQVVAKSDTRFERLDNLCFRAKNLYNRAMYLTRHSLFNKNFQFAGNFESDLKADEEYPDYRNMLDMASAQQVLRQVSSTWKAYFAAHRDWKRNPDKYTGEPKIPKYLKTDGRYRLLLQQVLTAEITVLLCFLTEHLSYLGSSMD